MDFELTPEQEMWRRTIREFAEKEITPLIDEAEEKEKFPVEILPKMASLGYLGAAFPAECSGECSAKRTSLPGEESGNCSQFKLATKMQYFHRSGFAGII